MTLCTGISAVAVIAVLISGCGGDDTSKPEAEAPPPETSAGARPGTLGAVVSCARSSGLNVERRGEALIAITGQPGQGQVTVERMPSAAAAKKAAKQADLIESTVNGRIWAKYGAQGEVRTTVDTCVLTGSPE